MFEIRNSLECEIFLSSLIFKTSIIHNGTPDIADWNRRTCEFKFGVYVKTIKTIVQIV